MLHDDPPLEVGALYLFRDYADTADCCHFTVLRNNMNSNYTVYVHEDGKQQEWNVDGLYSCFTKL